MVAQLKLIWVVHHVAVTGSLLQLCTLEINFQTVHFSRRKRLLSIIQLLILLYSFEKYHIFLCLSKYKHNSIFRHLVSGTLKCCLAWLDTDYLEYI